MQRETVYVGRRADSLETAEQLAGYSRVIVKSVDASYTAGDDSGSTLSLECPWGTQEMADEILGSVQGVVYQPYKTTGAIADPAAELGDAVDVGDTHGGIYMAVTKFGRLITSDLSAPAGNETDHEYVYTPKKERQVTRKLSQQSASIGALSAKTDKLLEDYESLIAEVGGIAAGMEAYVRNDTFNDYKEAVARLFAEVNEEDENIRSELTLHASSIDGLQEASADLITRVSGAETALEMQSQSLDDLQTARTELAARVDFAEASLEQKAEKQTVQDLDESVKTLYTAQTNLNTRIGNAESSLTQKVSVTDFDEALAAEQQAITELSAQVDGAEAKISLNAQNINGVTSSLAKIEADVVKLQGDTTILGNFTVEGGNIRASKGIVSDSGITGASIYANGTGSQGIISGRRLSCTEMALNGKDYTPQQITSKSGAVLALGIA